MTSVLQARSGTVEELAVSLARRASALRDIDLTGPLETAGAALPGSQTSSAAAAVGIRLATSAQVLAGRADEMASAARETAASLAAVDGRAAGRMVMR